MSLSSLTVSASHESERLCACISFWNKSMALAYSFSCEDMVSTRCVTPRTSVRTSWESRWVSARRRRESNSKVWTAPSRRASRWHKCVKMARDALACTPSSPCTFSSALAAAKPSPSSSSGAPSTTCIENICHGESSRKCETRSRSLTEKNAVGTESSIYRLDATSLPIKFREPPLHFSASSCAAASCETRPRTCARP